MKKYYILLISILFCTNIYSQEKIITDTGYSVSGKVMLDNFGIMAPLIGSVVKIVGTNLGVVTNELGEFNINNLKPGLYKINISYIGYPNTDTSIEIINEPIDSLIYTLKIICNKYNEETARRDILSNNPKLLLFGSIVPIYYKGQEKFEQKYKIKYYDFGCVPEDCFECFEIYNKIIFKYLDKKFGKKWRKTVRKDVLGFKE